MYALLIASALMADAQSAAAADRDKLPPETWPQVYYLSAEHLSGEAQADTVAAVRWMLASASRAPVLDGISTPVLGRPGLLRIDLLALGWEYATWRDIVGRNPYGPSFPLVLRADWLLYELADGHRSDAYLRLLFGEKPPKTRDDFLQRLGVIAEPSFRFGMIEGQSGVSVQGTRWIENRPVARGYAWGTRDVLRVVDASDPVEHPRGDFQHDGEEWIIGLPIVDAATGARGVRQVYFLANGKGEHVTRAPVDLVRDSTRFAGYDEIRAPGSCIQCHSRGLNDPTTNALRGLLTSGVALDAQSFSELAAFHLGDLSTEIARNQADYETGVRIVTGLEPEELASAFKKSVDRYFEMVDLATAARELGVSPERLTEVLEQASQRESIGARLASLARGGKLRRETWAELFLTARLLLGDLPAQRLATPQKPPQKPAQAVSQRREPPKATENTQGTRGRQRGTQRTRAGVMVPQRKSRRR